MLKTWKVFLNKNKRDTSSNDNLVINKTKADLTRLIESQLTNASDILEFEVNPNKVASVLEVIDKPPLSDRFIIVQSPDVLTIFQAKMVQLGV